MLRFHLPLIKPDVRISRIRLSDKESRGRTREVASSHLKLDEPQGVINIMLGIACDSPAQHLVLPTQPLTEPMSGVVNGTHQAILKNTNTTRATGNARTLPSIAP